MDLHEARRQVAERLPKLQGWCSVEKGLRLAEIIVEVC